LDEWADNNYESYYKDKLSAITYKKNKLRFGLVNKLVVFILL